MAGVLDRLVYEVGYDVDKNSFNNVKKGVSDITTSFKRMAKYAAGAGAALIGFTVLTTTQTAEMQRLAAAMGVSEDTMDAFGNEMKKIGGTTENFLDLIEETSNKIGEMKGLGDFNTLEESLGILNLKFKDLEKLSPEEQFKAITTAALEMEDAQKAVTAVDMLMAGEANKLIASLRAQGLTYDDVIRKQKMLSFQTDESRKNSLNFANALNDLTRMVSSLAKFLAGELGSIMNDIVNQFVEWTVANKELIASGVIIFVKTLSAVASGLWVVFRTLINAVKKIVYTLGGFERVIRLIIATGVVLGIIKIGQAILFIGVAARKALVATTLLNASLKIMRNLLVIGFLITVFEDLIGWINGADSAMGRLVGNFDVWVDDMQEGLKQLGSLVVDFFLSPLNLVIDALNTITNLIGFVGKVNIKPLENIKTEDVFSGLSGQASLKELTRQAVGFNKPNGVINNSSSNTTNELKTTATDVTNNITNTFDVNIKGAGSSTDIAREVGRELERVFQNTNTALQTVNK